MNAVEIEHVSKTFGTHRAVDDLSLAVPEGSIYGFIGPNGSGKTTTLRMMMHIILPDNGTIDVLGRRASADTRDQVGYLPEERGLYKKMPVRRLLRYYGRLKGRTSAQIDHVARPWLERLDLTTWADARVDQLSKGMAQKVQFLASIVAEPRLLILDEPFSGLDPVNAASLRDAILDLRRAGTTVLFSTHDMLTAERLCDRICMIFRGRKVLDGTLDAIQAEHARDTIRVRLAAGRQALDGIEGIDTIVDHGNYQDLRVSGRPTRLLQALAARTEVYHFEVVTPSLADIFVGIAGGPRS
jgi:ABC-2 type transport system ATP-binding protein